MNKKMNPVVHFEIPAENMDRMRAFYTEAFGWETQQLGEEMGNYVLAHTTETNGDPMVKTPGVINGGFYKRTNDSLSQFPSIVISVENINDAIERIKEAGGTVVGGSKKDGSPDDIPGVGIFASVIDTEGNRISILEPKDM